MGSQRVGHDWATSTYIFQGHWSHGKCSQYNNFFKEELKTEVQWSKFENQIDYLEQFMNWVACHLAHRKKLWRSVRKGNVLKIEGGWKKEVLAKRRLLQAGPPSHWGRQESLWHMTLLILTRRSRLTSERLHPGERLKMWLSPGLLMWCLGKVTPCEAHGFFL